MRQTTRGAVASAPDSSITRETIQTAVKEAAPTPAEESKPAAPPQEAPSSAPEIAPTPVPQEEKPAPPAPERPIGQRRVIPRSAPIPIPFAVAEELGEFESAYAVNADTRSDPAKMARFLESVGFNTLVQWITANPREWKTGQIVGFVLAGEGKGE